MKMNGLFHKRNTIFNNIDQFFDPNVQLTFFVYNISSLGPSLHSVNRQCALHKMNTKFQFGTDNFQSFIADRVWTSQADIEGFRDLA